MATNSVEDPKDFPRPPPPYSVGASGSAYVFTENWRRSNGSSASQQIATNVRARATKDDTKFLTLMHAGSIIILVLCALSNIIALHRNSKIMEQNLELLEKQLRMTPYRSKSSINTAPATTLLYNARNKRAIQSSNIIMVNPLDFCPPCTTEAPPNPIEPHRNPVSVLNELVGKHANYELKYLCEDPHIHEATLEITDDPNLQGKSWTGRGKNMQDAKQAAAWEAIQKDFPSLVDLVADEYKPSPYNHTCKQPHTF